MQSQILSIILPIRVVQGREQLITQIENIFLDKILPSTIKFIIVDDGSEEIYAQQIKEKCQSLKLQYVYLNTQDKPFSLSRARNSGVLHTESKFIMFQDLDMLPYNGFYKDILLEIKAQELDTHINSFIMISVIYLSKQGTQKYSSRSKQYFIDKMLQNDLSYVEKFSSGTSIILLHKEHFHSIGGYDENFSKWGHEDIDLNCRLILKDNSYILPKEFYRDEKNFTNIFEYKGWKSIYRLYGDRTFLKGIVLFHAWHKIDKKDDYYSNKLINKEYFHKKLLQYLKEYTPNTPYQITSNSILFDRYKYSMSSDNRLKCKSILHTVYYKLKKYLYKKDNK